MCVYNGGCACTNTSVCKCVKCSVCDICPLCFSWNLFSGLCPKSAQSPVCIIPVFKVNTSSILNINNNNNNIVDLTDNNRKCDLFLLFFWGGGVILLCPPLLCSLKSTTGPTQRFLMTNGLREGAHVYNQLILIKNLELLIL